MKLDEVTIPIEERSLGQCLDLGILFYREHFFSILLLVSLFAIPHLLLGAFLVELGANFFALLALFLFLAPLSGAALVAAAGRRVFGESLSVARALEATGQRIGALLFLLTLRFGIVLAGLTCLWIPGMILSATTGFFAEILVLEQLTIRRTWGRQSGLLRGRAVDVILRHGGLGVFYILAWIAIFIVVDLALGTLVGYPLLISRWDVQLDFLAGELRYFLMFDPRVLLGLFTVGWVLYPVWRLAWFFCYLDQRIRRESWDLELDFRREAERLGGVS